MKIIIVGDGKVGFTLAKYLSKENNDLVIIDNNLEALKKASDYLDVMTLKGNGLSTNILIEAGASEADLIIAATSRDEINMLCCLTAKKLGTKHTIARIRDPEYAQELSILKQELELDLCINPEQEAAAEIARIIKFPSASNVEAFARGRAEMIHFTVRAEDPIVGISLAKISSKYKDSILFCAIERNEEVFIPHGDFIINEDDDAYIIGEAKGIIAFFKSINRTVEKVKSVIIVGGSIISYYLTNMLNDAGIKVKIIEDDETRCRELSDSLSNALIIHGEGVDEDTLKEHGLEETGAFIALNDIDEENLFSALYATHMGVPKVIAKIDRFENNGIIRKLGLKSIISPKIITAFQIIRYVRALKNTMHSEFEALYQIVGDKAEALEFTATENTKFLNIPLKKLNLKKEILVAAIVRKDKIIIPKGNDWIEKSDSVIIVTKSAQYYNLNQIVE